MISAVRRIQFCAGHRVCGHDGPCGHLHGHNYVAFFHAATDDTAPTDQLDDLGMVIDFSILKQRLGGWIEKNWDHGFICDQRDDETQAALKLIPHQKTFLLDANPTAENMARYLLRTVGPEQLAGTGVHLTRVVLWETENCYAEASL